MGLEHYAEKLQSVWFKLVFVSWVVSLVSLKSGPLDTYVLGETIAENQSISQGNEMFLLRNDTSHSVLYKMEFKTNNVPYHYPTETDRIDVRRDYSAYYDDRGRLIEDTSRLRTEDIRGRSSDDRSRDDYSRTYDRYRYLYGKNVNTDSCLLSV